MTNEERLELANNWLDQLNGLKDRPGIDRSRLACAIITQREVIRYLERRVEHDRQTCGLAG